MGCVTDGAAARRRGKFVKLERHLDRIQHAHRTPQFLRRRKRSVYAGRKVAEAAWCSGCIGPLRRGGVCAGSVDAGLRLAAAGYLGSAVRARRPTWPSYARRGCLPRRTWAAAARVMRRVSQRSARTMRHAPRRALCCTPPCPTRPLRVRAGQHRPSQSWQGAHRRKTTPARAAATAACPPECWHAARHLPSRVSAPARQAALPPRRFAPTETRVSTLMPKSPQEMW